jgi:phosphatidate phosphatase APP1
LHWQVFELPSGNLGANLLRPLIGLDDEEMTAAEKEIYRERMRGFLVDNERGKQVPVRLASQVVAPAKTEPGGHAWASVIVPQEQAAPHIVTRSNGLATLPVQADTNQTQGRVFAGEVFLVPPSGWSVISDLDDTIKISQVSDRKELIRNTFCRPFKPVEGMAAVYQRWSRNERAFLHYVTASPWQLYEPLANFARDAGFPQGVWHMKPVRFTDRTALNLTASPESYKIPEISRILERYPQRQFILVGDSGEKDPEIYGELARRFPDRVRLILIREVSDDPVDGARYREAFRGLSPTTWKIFREAKELPDRLPE